MFLIVNVGTARAYSKNACTDKVYATERAAKGVCTRLNREYSGYEMTINMPEQWKVMSHKEHTQEQQGVTL